MVAGATSLVFKSGTTALSGPVPMITGMPLLILDLDPELVPMRDQESLRD